MIQWSDVVVCYEPDVRYPVNALDHVSLRVGAGEWVFFVGPSGAGKSTLLKLVYCGARATSGKIVVDDQDVTRLAAREIPLLRRKVGVIFQDFQLLAQKTVWENVAFALQVIGAPQKRLVRDVPRALETVGLTHKAGAQPHELSGGEAQRVAIARAIVNDPKILIADEPTGNLDPQTAADIAQVLRKINERGTTILMATHDRALVDAMKNRVVRIAEGRVVSDEAQGVYHPEDDEPRSDALPTPAPPASSVISATRNSSAADATGTGAPSRVRVSVAPAPVAAAPVAPISVTPDTSVSGIAADGAARADDNAAAKARDHKAPIGSPENPIVQLERSSDNKLPHEVER